jgi:hypothetical protein
MLVMIALGDVELRAFGLPTSIYADENERFNSDALCMCGVSADGAGISICTFVITFFMRHEKGDGATVVRRKAILAIGRG